MHKFYKQRLYKKYNDEIWGHLVSKKKFSYNKKAVLLNYRDRLLRKRLRIRTKYRYYRKRFLKRLNYTKFQFRNFRKRLRVLSFVWKGFTTLRWKFSKLKFTIKNNKSIKLKFFRFKPSVLLKFNLLNLKSLFKKRVIHSRSKVSLCVEKFNLFLFPYLFDKKSNVMWRTINFLRKNNLQFIVKKKLNLRKEKVFFYSVHVAAPRKKKKKWSLFGLKNIYYKKVSAFFGYKKVSAFFKLYNQVISVLGKNQFQLFLSLEGRLENLLLRLNFFPSIYFIKRFITSGNVFVNNKVITYSSYFLNYNEIISIEKKYFKLVYYFLKSKMRSKRVFLNTPSFIEVDYKLMVAMMIRSPEIIDLTRPVSFDLYTKFPSFNR